VTGIVRVLIVFGLLVLGAVLMILRLDERTVSSEKPATSAGEQRPGRSTLSHGGPGVGSSPGAQERLFRLDQNAPPEQSPYAAKR